MSTPTAGGITVHRCVVRVVRRGGWSWGPDPRSLVQRVVDALPDLLAEQFAAQLEGDGPDVEITSPVVVTVRLGQSRDGVVAFVPGATEIAVSPVVVEPFAAEPVAESVVVSAGLADEPAVALVPADEVTPTALFAELAERGELVALLGLLPDAALVTYLIAVLADDPLAAEGTVAGEVVAEFARRRSQPRPADLTDLQQLLLSGAGEIASAVAAVSAPVSGTLTGTEDSDTAGDAVVHVTSSVDPVAVGETRVCGALPFLLVGQLARTGYLSAIGPALAGVDLLGEAPLFAAALAYKVLGAPERGWRRTGADHVTAAAFAGLESVPDLGAFARRVRQALPLLDGVLALTVCRGHDPGDPLLVTGVDGGLLLVDSQGMFPITWAQDVAGLLPHWVACGRPGVAVCDSPLPATCLRDLASAGVAFVTDVRPLRGDPLTRLPWRTPLWTAGDVDPGLAAALPAWTDGTHELVRELFTERRAVLRPDDHALDHSVALAASLGLGMIAWTLWQHRENPDPVSALTRFADLEATVSYGDGTVHVLLPRGRRHADLLDNGVLADVHDVVWLGGRTLTFSGG